MKIQTDARDGKATCVVNDKKLDVSHLYEKLNNIGKITQSFKEQDSFDNRLVILSVMNDSLIEGCFNSSELRKIADIMDEFNFVVSKELDDAIESKYGG